MEKRQRLAVLGLDGCSWEYLSKAINSGYMPTIKDIINNAKIKAYLRAFPPCTPSSWSSIMTGVNPGKHGIFDFMYFDKTKKKYRLANTLDLEHPRIHEIFSFNGLKSIVINPIPSYPLFKLKNIIQISHMFFTHKTIWTPTEAERYARILGNHSY